LDSVSKDALELVLKHLTDRIAAAVLLLSGVSFLFSLFSSSVHLWVQSHFIWFFFGVAGSVCYLATRPILVRWNEWETRRKEQLQEQEGIRAKHAKLLGLTQEEEKILAGFIHGDLRSRRFDPNNPTIRGLEKEGILYAPDIRLDGNRMKAFNIETWVIEYYKTHRKPEGSG
jgi:hypothetical protein